MKINVTDLTFSPYRFIKPSLRSICRSIFFVLLPQFILLILSKSYSSLILLVCSVSATVLAQVFFFFITQKKTILHFEFAVIEGILIGMCIPSNFAYVSAFFIIFFAMIIGKHLFGEFPNAWANPINIAVLLLFFLGKPFFDAVITKSDFLFSHNLLPQLIVSNNFELLPLENNFFNDFFIQTFDTPFPEGYITLFWDSQSLIPAFRFNMFTLIASLFLFAFDAIDQIIPVCFLAMYGFLIYFFGSIFSAGTYEQGDVLFALLTSGTLFTAFFILPWFGTVPKSHAGKITYGLLAGLLAFFINGTGLSTVGSFFVVLLINIISPLILLFEDFAFNYFNKKLVRMKLFHEN